MLDIPEEPIVAHDGETRFLHTCKVGIYDDTGQPTYLLGVSIDITERKKAQDSLEPRSSFRETCFLHARRPCGAG